MGCCKGRNRRSTTSQPAQCKAMEQAGSGFLLWPLATRNGVRVTVQTHNNGFVELSSFIHGYRCEGTVARMLLRYASDINRLASDSPSVLLPHSRTGISLADLIRLAAPPKRRVRNNGRSKTSPQEGPP